MCNERDSTLTLVGWDSERGLIVDAQGGIALLDDDLTVAAIWYYSGLISHWNKKHDRAVYVPSMRSARGARPDTAMGISCGSEKEPISSGS